VLPDQDAAKQHTMNTDIDRVIALIDTGSITDSRKEVLQVLINYIQGKRDKNEAVLLNFICTHNSRRSQFSQIWADVASSYHNIDIQSFSGGVEVTECNTRTIASLKRLGFEVRFESKANPKYQVTFDTEKAPSELFSKLFDDSTNPKKGFTAVMTCSHADENCPFVTGCEQRISLRYDDPKAYDDSPLESAMYDYRSLQIATEMFYIFSQIQ